jgi:hypothetical protein
MTTLQEIKQRLLTLKLGDSGIRITSEELMQIDIPGLEAFDLKRRAEWLQKQLPFRCSVAESATMGAWVFSRVADVN